jgi:hypothetical protein
MAKKDNRWRNIGIIIFIILIALAAYYILPIIATPYEQTEEDLEVIAFYNDLDTINAKFSLVGIDFNQFNSNEIFYYDRDTGELIQNSTAGKLSQLKSALQNEVYESVIGDGLSGLYIELADAYLEKKDAIDRIEELGSTEMDLNTNCETIDTFLSPIIDFEGASEKINDISARQETLTAPYFIDEELIIADLTSDNDVVSNLYLEYAILMDWCYPPEGEA